LTALSTVAARIGAGQAPGTDENATISGKDQCDGAIPE
jgi:hypothetical protein